MNERTRDGIRRHLTYANVVSTLALFLVIAGGTALAAKNLVTSRSIKDDSIVSKDLKDGAAVASSDVIDDSLTGQDIDESKLSLPAPPSTLPPSGPAGGGLAGTYPDPTIGADAVGSANVADNSLTGADVDENSLVFPAGPGTNPTGPAAGGLAGSYPNPTIGANAVGSSNIINDSIGFLDIGPNAVSGSEIAAHVVSTDELATVNIVTGSTATIANNHDFIASVDCPSGSQILGGGAQATGGAPLSSSYPSYVNGLGEWQAYVINRTGVSIDLTAYALCLSV